MAKLQEGIQHIPREKHPMKKPPYHEGAGKQGAKLNK